MVDKFEDSNPYCICVLFPNILINCLFKILEISIKIQLPDFRLFYPFLPLLMKRLPVTLNAKIVLGFFAGTD
jgi:hypothetical protein